MARAEHDVEPRRAAPAAPPSGALGRLGSALCIVLLAVVVGVLLALAIGGVLAYLGALVSSTLDR